MLYLIGFFWFDFDQGAYVYLNFNKTWDEDTPVDIKKNQRLLNFDEKQIE